VVCRSRALGLFSHGPLNPQMGWPVRGRAGLQRGSQRIVAAVARSDRGLGMPGRPLPRSANLPYLHSDSSSTTPCLIFVWRRNRAHRLGRLACALMALGGRSGGSGMQTGPLPGVSSLLVPPSGRVTGTAPAPLEC